MDNTIYYREPEYTDDNSEETVNDEYFNELLKARYSPNYWEKVKAVGDFIKALPLTTEDNDKLIALMLEHLKSVTSETFYIAFELGIQAAKSVADDKQDIKH